MLTKLSPVLIVDHIEPALPFWLERLGFEKTMEVPHGDELGFVILVRDGIEVMLQTRASVAADMPALAEGPARCSLFVEVDELAPILAASKGAEVVVPERTTFYGSREIGLRAPGGHVVVFAQFAPAK